MLAYKSSFLHIKYIFYVFFFCYQDFPRKLFEIQSISKKKKDQVRYLISIPLNLRSYFKNLLGCGLFYPLLSFPASSARSELIIYLTVHLVASFPVKKILPGKLVGLEYHFIHNSRIRPRYFSYHGYPYAAQYGCPAL